MAQVKDNGTVVVAMKEIKDVLALSIGLAKAYKSAKEDGTINFLDLPKFFPVLFLIGPAIEDIENVKIELQAATPEEAADLKAWVKKEVDGITSDARVDEFINASFALTLDLWIIINHFFLNPPTLSSGNDAEDMEVKTENGEDGMEVETENGEETDSQPNYPDNGDVEVPGPIDGNKPKIDDPQFKEPPHQIDPKDMNVTVEGDINKPKINDQT